MRISTCVVRAGSAAAVGSLTGTLAHYLFAPRIVSGIYVCIGLIRIPFGNIASFTAVLAVLLQFSAVCSIIAKVYSV